jgi:Spy/CpxP family protein refolding chaperone
MERRSWLKRLGLAVAGLGSIMVLGAFRHGGHGCGHGGDPARMEGRISAHLEEVLEDIEATPEQRAKILAVKDRLLAKGKALHAQRGEGMRDLLAEWEAPAVDVAKVHARIDARTQEMQAFAHEAADALGEVHAILTPEQRAKVAKKWKRRMQH